MAGVVAPVLLLADGRIVLGVAALLVGAGVVYLLGRSLDSLSRRWAVLVPAGFVVVDPLSLADPTLFLREHVRHVAPEPPAAAPDGVLDLRLGAGAGSVSVRFDEEIDLTRAARGRHGGATVTTAEIMVAVARRDEMLRKAAERRLPGAASRVRVGRQVGRSGGDPAAEQRVARVERDHLARRDARLRRCEVHAWCRRSVDATGVPCARVCTRQVVAAGG